MKKVTPYNSSESKKQQIKDMFDNISNSYDLLNHYLSFGMDTIWRRIAIKKIYNQPKKILDVATGTADFAISAAKYTDANIVGIDISQGMLDQGNKKLKKQKLNDRILLQLADSEDLPFEDQSFDAITAGFGIRNFENLEKGLQEIYRVLRTNGIVVILEPSMPQIFPIKLLYKLYFQRILPKIGSWVSKDKYAYSYLPNSVKAFSSASNFTTKLKETGFNEIKIIPLTLGVVTLYMAIK